MRICRHGFLKYTGKFLPAVCMTVDPPDLFIFSGLSKAYKRSHLCL